MRASTVRPVLIVEDDESARESYAALVEQVLAHDVVTADGGEQALDLLRGGLMPCVIVLDLSMPKMDGFTFRSHHLADPTLARCPVLVCSAHLETNLETLKASAYLQKPVEPEVLLRLIRAFCQP
jgi:CheY-like chemotaxis protein